MEIDALSESSSSSDDSINSDCFHFDPVSFDNFNVTYDPTKGLIFLWNTYQIFVADPNDLFTSKDAVSLIVDFEICDFISTVNFIVCLDYNGSVYTALLMNKNCATSLVRRHTNIIKIRKLTEECFLTLKLESNRIYLCLHRSNEEFSLYNKFLLENACGDADNITPKKSLLTSYFLHEQSSISNKIFKHLTDSKGCHIILISFDKLTVYACVFNSTTPPNESNNSLTIEKIYTSPTEICNFEIFSNENIVYVVLTLNIGTVVKISLHDELIPPKIVHLNASIQKSIIEKDSIYYTDYHSLWKVENPFSDKQIQFKIFFPKLVKDFTLFKDYIVCTTFNRFIRIFTTSNEQTFVKIPSTETCLLSENLLNKSDILEEILNESIKNTEITEKAIMESYYITALALTKRPNIMHKVIQAKIIVYENYQQILNNVGGSVILCDNFTDYFKPNHYFFLINLSVVDLEHTFANILHYLFDDLKLHVTISTKRKVLKTVSIKINKELNDLNILTCCSEEVLGDGIPIDICVRLITIIPGAHTIKEGTWATIYSTIIKLGYKNFIRTNYSVQLCIRILPELHIQNSIYDFAYKNHNDLFEITDISRIRNTKKYSVYLKLPNNYRQELDSSNYLDDLNREAKTKLVNGISSSSLECPYLVFRDIVMSKFHNEFGPLMSFTCTNVEVAFDIRMCFSNIYYSRYNRFRPGTEYVHYNFYTNVVNFNKSLKDVLNAGLKADEFESLAEWFNKNVIGVLPL